MEGKMKKMKSEDLCICSSKKRWGSCCGQQLREKEANALFVSFSGKQAVRFFLGNMFNNDTFTDDEGNVIVFTNRAQAIACNESLKSAFQVVGMAEEKWTAFQRDVPNHMVISDAVA
jgi:hypothetical protein